MFISKVFLIPEVIIEHIWDVTPENTLRSATLNSQGCVHKYIKAPIILLRFRNYGAQYINFSENSKIVRLIRRLCLKIWKEKYTVETEK